MKDRLDSARIAIVGLGYVGLPLAVEFGKQYATIGYDIHAARVAELRQGKDSTLEVEPELLAEATRLTFTDQLADGGRKGTVGFALTILQRRLASAYQGVTDAWSLGITSLPAVVVDQRYVVYGEPDVARAVARIEQHRRPQP